MFPHFFRQITQAISPYRLSQGAHRWAITMVIVLLLSQSSALVGPPAQAGDNAAPVVAPLPAGPTVEWARWILDLDFGKQDFATWRLVAGYDNTSVSPAQPVVLQEVVKDITANCRLHGTARIERGEAIFDGTGYIDCDLPSFVAELAALQTGLPLMGDCRCVKPDPFIYADLTLDRQLIGAGNPLFYEESFRFTVPWVGKRAAASRWWLDGQLVPDHLWPIATGGNAIFAGVGAQYFVADQLSGTPINQPALYSAIQATPLTHFLQWADTATANHFSWAGTFQMTTEEMTVYIGYDPDTNDYLKARVRQLVVDPPCKSN